MRAIVVRPPAAGVAQLEVPAPARPPGSVRVGVLEGGVCGTDRDIVAGRYGRAPEGTDYLILGHENFGRVLEVEGASGGLAVGELVVATVRRGCGACRFCAVGRSDFCETGRYTERGISGAPGYFADQYVERPEYLVRVPDGLAPSGVLLEPLSVVEKAVEQGKAVLSRKEPTPGHPAPAPPRALVAGTGAIGMLSALVLRTRGFAVTAIDRHDGRTAAADLLRVAGADHVNAAAGLSALGATTFDLIVEASGSAALDLALVDRLGPNGVLVLTGLPDGAGPPTPIAAGSWAREVVLGNRAIVGSVNANRAHFEAGIADLLEMERRWPGLAARLVTRRVPADRFAELLEGPAAGAIKAVLAFAPVKG